MSGQYEQLPLIPTRYNTYPYGSGRVEEAIGTAGVVHLLYFGPDSSEDAGLDIGAEFLPEQTTLMWSEHAAEPHYDPSHHAVVYGPTRTNLEPVPPFSSNQEREERVPFWSPGAFLALLHSAQYARWDDGDAALSAQHALDEVISSTTSQRDAQAVLAALENDNLAWNHALVTVLSYREERPILLDLEPQLKAVDLARMATTSHEGLATRILYGDEVDLLEEELEESEK